MDGVTGTFSSCSVGGVCSPVPAVDWDCNPDDTEDVASEATEEV